jgi:hypothetical protein
MLGSPVWQFDPVAYSIDTWSGSTRPQDDSAPRQDFYDGGFMTAGSGWFDEFGKRNAKGTDTLREIPLGKFEQFICKSNPLLEEHHRKGEGSTCS